MDIQNKSLWADSKTKQVLQEQLEGFTGLYTRHRTNAHRGYTETPFHKSHDTDNTAPYSCRKSAIIRQFLRPWCCTHQALSHPPRRAAVPGQEGTAGARGSLGPSPGDSRPCPAAIPSLFRARPGAGAGAGLGLAVHGGTGERRARQGGEREHGGRKGRANTARSTHPSLPAALPTAPQPMGRAERGVRAPQPGTGRLPALTRGLPSLVRRDPVARPRPGRAPRCPSPMRMRICFLPKRREKSEEMVRPMAAPAALGGGGGALREGGREGARPGRCARTDPSALEGSPAAAAGAL